jgi:hypothetical protein
MRDQSPSFHDLILRDRPLFFAFFCGFLSDLGGEMLQLQ